MIIGNLDVKQHTTEFNVYGYRLLTLDSYHVQYHQATFELEWHPLYVSNERYPPS